MSPLQSVARELCRSATFTPSGDDTADGRTLTGYAATFGQPTEINSWEGHFFETIRAGAFKKSLRERTPVMQFDHGRHPLIGSIPIGSIEDVSEDEHGLFTEARISDNWLMQPVRDAIAEGSVTGMSFRFEVVREEWRDKDGKVIRSADEVLDLLWMPGERGPLQRELIELKVRELGPVVFPAYESTSVGVRARDVASTFTENSDLVSEVRSALARDVADTHELDDPDLRRDVARALLFERMGAPVTTDHPPAPEEPVPVSAPAAPSADGHPASTDPTTARMKANLREVIDLMRDVTESISEESPK